MLFLLQGTLFTFTTNTNHEHVLDGDILSLDPILQNVSKRTAMPEAVLGSRKPMREIFPGCRAPTGELSAKSMAQRVRTVIILFMFFSALSTRHSSLTPRLI
jgi:hypothetical protein